MPKIVNHDAYKQKLVEASFDLISSRGYAALSMRDLAHALCISTGTLYHYFPSKLSLFEAILQRYCLPSIDRQAEFGPSSQSFDEGLDKLIDECREQHGMWTKILLTQLDAYRVPEARAIDLSNNLFASRSTRQYISNLLHIDNDQVIDLFCALMIGIIIQSVICNKQVDWDKQKNLLCSTFKHYAH